jgi:hypothetical protein
MDPFYDTFGLGKKFVDIEDEKEKGWEHRTVKTKVMATLGPATSTTEAITYTKKSNLFPFLNSKERDYSMRGFLILFHFFSFQNSVLNSMIYALSILIDR